MKTLNNVWYILSACVCLESVFCQYGFQNPYQEIPFAGPSLNSYPSHFLSYDYYGTPTYTGYIPRVAMENDFNQIGDSISSAGFDQRVKKLADEQYIEETVAPFRGFSPDGPEEFPFHGFNNDKSGIQNVGLAGADNLDMLSNPNRFHQQHMPPLTMPVYPNHYNPYGLTPGPPFKGIIPSYQNPDISKTYRARQEITAPSESDTEIKNPYHKPFEEDRNPFLTDFIKSNPNGIYQTVPNQIYVPLFQTNLHRYDWNKLLNKFGQIINTNTDDRIPDSTTIDHTTEQSIRQSSEQHRENNKPTELSSEPPTTESTKLPDFQQPSSIIPNEKEYFPVDPKEDNSQINTTQNTDTSFSDKNESQSLYSLDEYESGFQTTEKIWTKKPNQNQKNFEKENPYILMESLDTKPTTSASEDKSFLKQKKKVIDVKRTNMPLEPTALAVPTRTQLNYAKNEVDKNHYSNNTTKAERDNERTKVIPDNMEDDDDEISRKYIAPIPSKIPTMNELINARNQTSKNNHSNDIVKALQTDESTEVLPNNLKDNYDENQNTPTEPWSTVKPPKVETTTTYYTFKTNEKRHDASPTSPYGNQNTIDSFNKKEDSHVGSPYFYQNSLKDQKYNGFKNKENVVDVDDSVDDVNSGMLNSGPEDERIENDAEVRDCIGTEKRETKIEVTFNRPETGTSPKMPYLVDEQAKPLDKFRNKTAVTIKATSTPKTTEIIVESRIPENIEDSCQTKDSGRGTCMILYSCKPLLEKVARATEDDVSLLRKAHCGFDGTIPKVCCPPTTGPTSTSTLRPSPVTKRSLPKDMNLVDLFPKPPECGVGGDLQGPAGRIVGGLPAKLGSFPWMALLGYKTRAGTPDWKCGGSLITDSHVLTAAHCILHQENNLYIVRLGELDTARDDDGATPDDVFIRQMIMHQEYDPKTLTNDIGIVALNRKVLFTPLIKPICLPLDEELRKKTFEKYMPVVAGWGNTAYLSPESSYLRAVQLPVVTNKFCDEVYSRTPHRTNVIDERVLCAGFSKGKDSCQGDSGGPLMQPLWNSNNLVSYFYQIGIVSYGKKCGVGGVPGVYTRVTSFIPWIQQTVAGTLQL